MNIMKINSIIQKFRGSGLLYDPELSGVSSAIVDTSNLSNSLPEELIYLAYSLFIYLALASNIIPKCQRNTFQKLFK